MTEGVWEGTMDSSTDILAFASQILAFLGFLATCIAVLRYLNPGPEYIALADLVGQVRQSWTEYENDGMPTDEYTLPFLSTLERYANSLHDPYSLCLITRLTDWKAK